MPIKVNKKHLKALKAQSQQKNLSAAAVLEVCDLIFPKLESIQNEMKKQTFSIEHPSFINPLVVSYDPINKHMKFQQKSPYLKKNIIDLIQVFYNQNTPFDPLVFPFEAELGEKKEYVLDNKSKMLLLSQKKISWFFAIANSLFSHDPYNSLNHAVNWANAGNGRLYYDFCKDATVVKLTYSKQKDFKQGHAVKCKYGTTIEAEFSNDDAYIAGQVAFYAYMSSIDFETTRPSPEDYRKHLENMEIKSSSREFVRGAEEAFKHFCEHLTADLDKETTYVADLFGLNTDLSIEQFKAWHGDLKYITQPHVTHSNIEKQTFDHWRLLEALRQQSYRRCSMFYKTAASYMPEWHGTAKT